jgi:hypothetical protein
MNGPRTDTPNGVFDFEREIENEHQMLDLQKCCFILTKYKASSRILLTTAAMVQDYGVRPFQVRFNVVKPRGIWGVFFLFLATSGIRVFLMTLNILN